MGFTIMSQEEEYLTTKEVRAQLRIGRSKMYDLLRSGEISHVNLGHRSIRITRVDLDAYLAKRGASCS